MATKVVVAGLLAGHCVTAGLVRWPPARGVVLAWFWGGELVLALQDGVGCGGGTAVGAVLGREGRKPKSKLSDAGGCC